MADSRRDFFISFNGADLAYAEAIDKALKDAGFTTYFHPVDLPPGGIVPAWMEEALVDSNQTLALFSPDYVKDEAAFSAAEKYASWWSDPRGRKRKLIPILLRKVDFSEHPIIGTISRIECLGKEPAEAAAETVKRLKGREETGERAAAQLGGNLPPIFHVLYRPNPNFTGRFEALDSLQASLRTGNAAVTALAGMGGIGKTTLVAEYCHHFGGRYAGVWWIRAEQESVMLSDITELGTRLKLEQTGNIENDARACIEHLTTCAEPWLLVYDNVPNADAVGKWLPAGKTRAVITSRRNEFDGIAKVMQLDQWTDEVTADYLLTRTGRDDKAGAKKLAKTLGGLPLAAEQAAVYLANRKGISFDDYGAEIVRLIKEPRPAGSKGDYPDTVYAAFVKSLETLEAMKGGNIALNILQLCAFLSPDGVDLELLCHHEGEYVLPDALATAMKDKFEREEALAGLASLSLLRREEGPAGQVLIFHRLLLEVVRDWMGVDTRTLWGTAAVCLVSAVFPFDSDDDPSSWPLCARLMPHLVPLEAHVSPTGVAGKALDRTLNHGGLYLGARGDGIGALALIERSVELGRTTRADEPLELAAGLNNLGGRYADIGRLEDAERVLGESLSIQEPRCDPPGLATTLSNLARVYWLQQKFDKAAPIITNDLELMRTTYGETSAQYGQSLANLGALYGNWADEPGEERWRRHEADFTAKGLTVTLAALGPRHPQTAFCYSRVALMKAKTENWPGAATAMERAVAIRLSLDLAGHNDMPTYLATLGVFLEQSGQKDKSTRLWSGDLTILASVVEQIEAEHRVWVAQDTEHRKFGPPSPITGATK